MVSKYWWLEYPNPLICVVLDSWYCSINYHISVHFKNTPDKYGSSHMTLAPNVAILTNFGSFSTLVNLPSLGLNMLGLLNRMCAVIRGRG